MDKEELTEQLRDGLKSLRAMKYKEQHELNQFQQKFDELYTEKICDTYLYLRTYGITHFIFYDDNRCLVVKPVEQYAKDQDDPSVVLEFSRFSYRSPWDIRFTLERMYADEKKEIIGFKRALVLEQYLSEQPFRYSVIDYAVMKQGFTRMKLSEPIGIATSQEGKKTKTLEGRILDICERADANKKPC